MQKRKHNLIQYQRAWHKYLKSKKRKDKKRRKRFGLHKHRKNIIEKAKIEGRAYKNPKKERHIFVRKNPYGTKPKHSLYVSFLSSIPSFYNKKHSIKIEDGRLFVPEVFSLIDNEVESFKFLKTLFGVLYNGMYRHVIIDYEKCTRIDVDASICMDILLIEFINYLRKCEILGHKLFPETIIPVNINNENVSKVLYSIGAPHNIKGIDIKYEDIEALPVLSNNKQNKYIWNISELHQTEIVEYIKKCTVRLGRELTIEAETSFYKVIGEIMSNAEEHATMPHRFAIGYFQESNNSDEHFGIFNFSIFNFGDTIYKTFKSPKCLNPEVVEQMKNLSVEFTRKGFMKRAEFEEETLWTLYALQEGVTSKVKKRGNGSIQYINNFFNLKGDMSKDNISKLVIVSGNTRIIFDGSYQIIEIEKPGEKRKFKMITFNETGNISDKPDKKYVNFAPEYFPGTLISARILIKHKNTI